MKEPSVSVGIVEALQIRFVLNANYQAKGEMVHGEQVVEYDDGGIRWNGNLYQELMFTPRQEGASFSLYEVTIGINFHWERKETQTFSGALRLLVQDGKLCAINMLPVEDYLTSVISSEMSADASIEFLKAHAVISRSWLMAQIERRARLTKAQQDVGFFASFRKTDTQLVRWYDREDHTLFDVCADDHCQRYQGITRATNPAVAQAVESTRGQVLKYDGEICDARFSKCCGGVSEEFSTCWEETDKPYLVSVRDYTDDELRPVPDLRDEREAAKWILASPRAFCNTRSQQVLSQILTNYDRETSDFYRWTVTYSQAELSALIAENLKMEFGQILDLIPLQRGRSGRISQLQIVGSERTLTIGKELEIRRALSDSHLFSSAFVVEKCYDRGSETPSTFILRGAGWGHGVGLCQIGAAVMGERGYAYDAILLHYYKGAKIDVHYQ